jgi:hypothetical protein
MKNVVIYGIMHGMVVALSAASGESHFPAPQCVQPLHANLFAGTVAHWLLYVLPGLVAEQAIDPAHQLILMLACGIAAGG